MTVEQNAGIELDVLGWKPERKRKRVRDLLNRVGLNPDKFCDRMPSELSGGEAQRVGIVRALAAEPLMILMDEPFSALDPVSRKQLQDLVLQLHEELGITVIFVTHDMSEAMLMADRLAIMRKGELQQCGTPAEVMAKPANEFVRSFFLDRAADSRYLSNIVDAGFGVDLRNNPASSDVSWSRELSASDTVVDLAAAFHAAPRSGVKMGNHLLRQSDLIAYLASISAERKGEEAAK
jgi:osmoprotectant transport system ATP-binding protein